MPQDHPLLRKSRLSTLSTVTTYLTAVVVLLFILWMISSILNAGITSDPIFFPIQSFLFILWLMLTVVNMMFMALHALRIQWTSDDKEALWRVNDYGNGAKAVIVICIFLIVLFGYPPIMAMLTDQMSQPEAPENNVNDFSFKFNSGDPLNLTSATKIIVEAEGGNMTIGLFTKKSVDDFPDWTGPVKATSAQNVTHWKFKENLRFGEYYLHIESDTDPDVTITVQRNVDPNFILYFVWFPMILLIANINWAIVLFLMRQRVIKRYISKEQAKLQKAFTIEEVFLIYKDGRLISHNTRRLKADVDKDVLTGMLTAVQNFVGESFQKDEAGILDEMHYGNLRILIEEGTYANFAVVVHGEEPKGIRLKMKKILAEIHDIYGAYLVDWDGDTTALSETKKIIGEVTPPPPPHAVQDFVEEVFLIHRDNRFIYHVTQRLGPDVDEELLIETMEYIKEKVGPTLNSSVQSLPRSLPYGDWTIMLEYSTDVYLAALLSGPEPRGFRNQMNNVLEEITMAYGQFLYQWSGEMDGLTNLRTIMDSMFIRMQLKGKRRRR